MSEFSRLSLMLLVAVVVSGCRFGPPPEPGQIPRAGIPLLAGLTSYTPSMAVREQLARAGLTDWRARRAWRSPNPSRPELNDLAASVTGFECGQTGTLHLAFVGDVLVGTMFSPKDFHACRQHLAAQGVAVASAPQADGPRRWHLGQSDYRHGYYSVSDARLEEEIQTWVGWHHAGLGAL